MVALSGIIKNAVSKTSEITHTSRSEVFIGGRFSSYKTGTKSLLELKIQNNEGEEKDLKFEGNSPVQVGDTIKVDLSEKIKDEILYIEKYVDGNLVRTDYSVNYKH